VFKKGDVLNFNKQGVQLFSIVSGSVGLITTDKKTIYEYVFDSKSNKTQFFVYDILVCGQLFMNIPEEFLNRITQK